VREPEPPDVRASASVGRRLRELPALLRSDPEFTRYFLARALATLGRMSMPFYVPFAATRFEVGGAQLGVLTLAFVMALSIANLGWGVLADRTGFRAVFIGSLVVWVGSVLLLMAMSSEAAMVGVMVGLGAGQGGFMMSSQNLVLEFGSRENLPMRIAVANSASELLGGLGTLAAGVLASVATMVAVFWTGIAFQLAAVVWVALFVRDPRHR
jgi:predicted MFS family arabinose efflux permease